MSPSRRAEQRRGSIPLAGADPAGSGPGRHGLTAKQVAAMRHQQRGLCAVCHRPLPTVPLVDHDHELARRHPHPVNRGCPYCVRGLLCNDCNLMLGYARDEPDTLRAGATYVTLYREARGG